MFASPGAGKTSIVLSVIKDYIKAGKIRRVLLIAPLRPCYSVWPKQIDHWSNFAGLKSEVFHGRDPKEIKESDAEIVIVNFNYLTKLIKNPARFKSDYGFDCLVIDELSAFKKISSKRFKLLKSVMDTFTYRWGLTGSPAANRLLDIFGQVLILDGGKHLGRYITHFKNRYFVPSGYGGYTWLPRDDSTPDEIYTKLKTFAISLKAEDYISMPELVVNDIAVTLPDQALKQYKQMERDLITEINKDKITAPTRAAALNKCRQIASGDIYYDGRVTINLDDDSIAHRMTPPKKIHDAKYEALKDLVDELQGEPLLIGIGFRFEAHILKKIFPGLEMIYGGTTAKESSRIIDAWNAREIPILAAHPASLAHGVNLQEGGSHIAWLTLPWDFELYDQFNRRLYRQGAVGNHVFIHRLIAEDTVDEYVRVLLAKKNKIQNGIFNFLKESIKV